MHVNNALGQRWQTELEENPGTVLCDLPHDLHDEQWIFVAKVNALHVEFLLGKHKYLYIFLSFLNVQTDAGSWDPSTSKSGTYWNFSVYTLAADALAM